MRNITSLIETMKLIIRDVADFQTLDISLEITSLDIIIADT